MMFNGLLMSGDSDTSDFTKDSVGCGSCRSEAARARSLENKLLATMQILKNKEETVRVQAESLALAEARIAALAAPRPPPAPTLGSRSWTGGCRVATSDASSAADLQDEQGSAAALRDDLADIEELYRECFYECAKQDELITLLRRSYLGGRRAGRASCAALLRYQDIAMEVENLKSEISSFLNSSQNNDSGVWERDESAADVAGELRAIAELLRRLRAVLETDCTCGLEEENMKLKRINETLERQTIDLRQRVNELEEVLRDKNDSNQQYQALIQEKEQELEHARSQLVALEEGSRDQSNTCDALNCQLQQLEAVLKDKSAELVCVKQQCEAHEATIKELREDFNRADRMARESGQVREEVSSLSAQVARWREQLAGTRHRLRALETELQRARDHCRHLAVRYSEKAQLAEELQSQLVEAQARGTELCGEARRAVCGVKHWLRKQRQTNREQEDKIKQQEMLIQRLQGGTDTAEQTGASDNEPCCSKHVTRTEARRSEHSFVSASETGCSKCASRKVIMRTTESDLACGPAPTPPKRLLRKKAFCGDIRCQWPSTHESFAQRPARSDASVSTRRSDDRLSSYASSPAREVSPTDELLERVERAHEALAAAHRRWSRAAPSP